MILKCDCGGTIEEIIPKPVQPEYRYKCKKCGVVMRNFEVIPVGKRILPLKKTKFWKKKGSVEEDIEKILGESQNRIVIPSPGFLYGNAGKCFHFDVLARDKKDLTKILKKNWEKLEKIMRLFGEKLIKYETLGT